MVGKRTLYLAAVTEFSASVMSLRTCWWLGISNTDFVTHDTTMLSTWKTFVTCTYLHERHIYIVCFVYTLLVSMKLVWNTAGLISGNVKKGYSFFYLVDLRREAESNLSFANSVIGLRRRRLRTSDDNDLEHVMNTESSLETATFRAQEQVKILNIKCHLFIGKNCLQYIGKKTTSNR